MAEKLVKREATRQFTLEGKTVEKDAVIEITPKMAKYLDGLKDCPVKSMNETTPKK